MSVKMMNRNGEILLPGVFSIKFGLRPLRSGATAGDEVTFSWYGRLRPRILSLRDRSLHACAT